MAAPDDVLWDYEEHTHAKHRFLVRYLHAWLPIMAGRNSRLDLIDGFAGPGRYKGGEPGSPLLMIDAYLSHTGRKAMDPLELHYDFIEVDPRRVAHLRTEIAALTLPANVHVGVTQGSFDAVMGSMLDREPCDPVDVRRRRPQPVAHAGVARQWGISPSRGGTSAVVLDRLLRVVTDRILLLTWNRSRNPNLSVATSLGGSRALSPTSRSSVVTSCRRTTWQPRSASPSVRGG